PNVTGNFMIWDGGYTLWSDGFDSWADGFDSWADLIIDPVWVENYLNSTSVPISKPVAVNIWVED
ncbi:MAG: hypothetical protein P1S60_19200, partial [Anaerolineae bacterium]|nr:hypothetical protein [Anaerolineae bacterium]